MLTNNLSSPLVFKTIKEIVDPANSINRIIFLTILAQVVSFLASILTSSKAYYDAKVELIDPYKTILVNGTPIYDSQCINDAIAVLLDSSFKYIRQRLDQRHISPDDQVKILKELDSNIFSNEIMKNNLQVNQIRDLTLQATSLNDMIMHNLVNNTNVDILNLLNNIRNNENEPDVPLTKSNREIFGRSLVNYYNELDNLRTLNSHNSLVTEHQIAKKLTVFKLLLDHSPTLNNLVYQLFSTREYCSFIHDIITTKGRDRNITNQLNSFLEAQLSKARLLDRVINQVENQYSNELPFVTIKNQLNLKLKNNNVSLVDIHNILGTSRTLRDINPQNLPRDPNNRNSNIRWYENFFKTNLSEAVISEIGRSKISDEIIEQKIPHRHLKNYKVISDSMFSVIEGLVKFDKDLIQRQENRRKRNNFIVYFFQWTFEYLLGLYTLITTAKKSSQSGRTFIHGLISSILNLDYQTNLREDPNLKCNNIFTVFPIYSALFSSMITYPAILIFWTVNSGLLLASFFWCFYLMNVGILTTTLVSLVLMGNIGLILVFLRFVMRYTLKNNQLENQKNAKGNQWIGGLFSYIGTFKSVAALNLQDGNLRKNIDQLEGQWFSINHDQSILNAKSQSLNSLFNTISNFISVLVTTLVSSLVAPTTSAIVPISLCLNILCNLWARSLNSCLTSFNLAGQYSQQEAGLNYFLEESFKEVKIKNPILRTFKEKNQLLLDKNYELNLDFRVSYDDQLVFDCKKPYKFKKSQKIAITGPSGQGKTIFLEAIKNIRHSQGQISLNGVALSPFDTKLCHQTSQDLASSSAKINLLFGLDEDPELLNRIKQITAIDFDLENRTDTLSGGQKQRLHLARTLYHWASTGSNQILLLDEALSAIDPNQRIKLTKSICSFCKNTLILSIVHVTKEELNLYDQIIFIRNNQIELHGKTSVILENKEFQEFLTSEFKKLEESSSEELEPAKDLDKTLDSQDSQ